MDVAIGELKNQIDVTLLEDTQRRWMSDSHNSLREFYKTDVIPMSESLSKNLKELQQELIEEVTDIQIKDKNKAKRTKPSTRLEEQMKPRTYSSLLG
ncbi:hypothetical protein Tco_1444216 [Tanacetum coccineum]